MGGGKFFSSACYSCIYIYSAELYPTSCRSTGFSCCVLSSRLATIVVPEIVAVSRSGAAWFAPVFFGCACLVAACGTWWLPDTFGVPLLETLEDAEKFYAKPSRTKRRGGDTSNLAADFLAPDLHEPNNPKTVQQASALITPDTCTFASCPCPAPESRARSVTRSAS